MPQNRYGGPNRGGESPRRRMENVGDYTRGQWEADTGPLINRSYENYGYGSESDIDLRSELLNEYRRFGGFGGGSSYRRGGGGGGGGYQQQGGGGQYGAGGSPEDRLARVSQNVSPNASKEEMEAALTEAYGDMPGFEEVYKESVKVNGVWYDLVNSFGGGNASWGGWTPKGGQGGGFVGGAGAGAFPSYGGFSEFAKTGGYSPEDIANMRARGVGPIRSTYANAQRELGRQRSLQGGYSPNASAIQAKMAREQGQLTSDATQNVEAGIAEARNRGKQFGLGGMFDVESLQNQNKWNALQGASSLYGTSPGMASKFGDQAMEAARIRGGLGQSQYGNDINAQRSPDAWDTAFNRANDVMDIYNAGAQIAYPYTSRRR